MFDLTVDSLKEIDTIMYIGIAKWKEEWWFSGVYIQQQFNADLVSEVKIRSKTEWLSIFWIPGKNG